MEVAREGGREVLRLLDGSGALIVLNDDAGGTLELFPAADVRPDTVPAGPGESRAVALRRRQAARIRVGLHPLSYAGRVIPLHPLAARVTEYDPAVGSGGGVPSSASGRAAASNAERSSAISRSTSSWWL